MKFARWILLPLVALGLLSGQSSTGAKSKTATSASADSAKNSQLIDINSASPDELDGLPGIGPALSKKIIAGRPYRSKTDLITKKVIPQSTYDKIKAKIIAHQAK
jgi:DNA uptake protein ComE-like DNA-binding protein